MLKAFCVTSKVLLGQMSQMVSFFSKETDLAGLYLVPQGRKLEEDTQHCTQ